ncbi:GPR endopeptidase [Clostridium felsineum]|uniref:GPR endopeptidase n=1 Tax=Clostridium felsineum TaxID=36839 RepID=UPI00098CDC37|nr:GPR endopeptidase [Clostridium felsineum]URZ15747.1 Germination protease [Clostridium felsineum DSM 794]
MKNVRTDLAVEARELYCKEKEEDKHGIKVSTKKIEDINITTVDVLNEEGEEKIRKPKGTYITLDIPKVTLYDSEDIEDISKVLAGELTDITNKIKLNESMTVLVVGLGNWNITPDALGPKVVDKLMVTRHLKKYIPDSIDEGIRPVCAVAPGVLGITGMETGEIIRGIVQNIKPDVVICVDALAARKMERVNSTIQIGDTGISPGSGVGNMRMEISQKTLGVPVIAIGVPTVVDAATMANDTIDIVIEKMESEVGKNSKFYSLLKTIDTEEKEELIHEVLNPYVGDLLVTPKEVDMIMETLSKIIASGINISLQPALELKDINNYIS